MDFRSFIKEKYFYFIFLIFLVVTTQIFLLPFEINFFIKIYIAIVSIIGLLLCFIIDYFKRKSFYNKLTTTMEELEEKYLISELIGNSDFLEGKILKEALQDAGKSMLENVNKYKYIQEEYKDYIELWIHEIKIPIAASKMVIENNKNDVTKSIDEEIEKIDDYIEQALFYARSNIVEKDYCIKKSNIKDIVNNSIIKNKRILISKNTNINVCDLDIDVYTDSKWVMFILNQIIQNSTKYFNKNNNRIDIYAKEKKEQVILSIKDNGMGIKKGEITRVFDKGFTGENGRIIGKKSTGIGLYLCKKLCDKLGIGIELNSEENVGTEVRICFPKGSFVIQ